MLEWNKCHVRRLLGVFGLFLLTATVAFSQGFGRRSVAQNEPPDTELVVARWRFGTNGWFGHMGWSHNYPNSDEHLNEFIAGATRIDVELSSYRIVDLGSDEIFDYPFAYVSEPGEMQLTDAEVANLREYVARGGFILMDDFDGSAQLANMRMNLRRAFPERNFEPVPVDHRIFDTVLELEDLGGLAPYVPGGEITYLALRDDRGEIAVVAGHNNDLANFWDWYGQARMPLEPAADAFRLGINFVVWSMTH